MAFTFALSLGLFSSAGIDAGTRLLLKILSGELDALPPGGFPRRVLDAGCGAGIIGVCAARALGDMPADGERGGPAPAFHVRAQDRDELAARFTAYNARRNGVAPGTLSAHTEPLLAGPPGSRWDLILSNIPAKAGRPVLEDFVPRSLGLLAPGGRVLLVAVNTLAPFFRALIAGAGGLLLREAAGSGHTVFVFVCGNAGASGEAARGGGQGGGARDDGGKGGTGGGLPAGPVKTGPDFLTGYPFYLRQRGRYRVEGTAYALDTVYGAPLFDDPGAAVLAAAKLLARMEGLDAGGPLLFHECAQGHFPLWFLIRHAGGGAGPAVTLSGRNILSLEAAAHNIRRAFGGPAGRDPPGAPALRVVPAVEPPSEALLPGGPGFSFIAAFPEPVSRTDRWAALWEAFSRILRPGGLLLVTLPSAEAERFGRKKTAGFARSGDLRRGGFRSLAFRKI
jgi:SAM-dependent methyltransferase